MKLKLKTIKEFNPTTLEITFETQEELEEFYGLFNTSAVAESLNYIPSTKIREELDALDIGACNNKLPEIITDKISKHITIIN